MLNYALYADLITKNNHYVKKNIKLILTGKRLANKKRIIVHPDEQVCLSKEMEGDRVI